MMAASSELPFGGCKDYCLKATAPPLNPSGLAERPGTFRGMKRKRTPMDWRAMAPCVTSPHPETDRLEAKQLRMCLLSKRELRY